MDVNTPVLHAEQEWQNFNDAQPVAEACRCCARAASRDGTPTKCVTPYSRSADANATGLRATLGGSTSMHAPVSRGPNTCRVEKGTFQEYAQRRAVSIVACSCGGRGSAGTCHTESTKVGAVCTQTTSSGVRGNARCIHTQRLAMPAQQCTAKGMTLGCPGQRHQCMLNGSYCFSMPIRIKRLSASSREAEQGCGGPR